MNFQGAVICPSDEDSQTFNVNAANGEIYRLRGTQGCTCGFEINTFTNNGCHDSNGFNLT